MRAKTLTTLTLMTLLVGCGDDAPGTVVMPDAAGETGADGNTPDGPPPPPPDGAPMDDVPPPPPPDVPPMEVGVDAGVDAMDMDVPPPPPVGGPDVPIGMDVPPPPDAPGPDVDTDVPVMPDVPVTPDVPTPTVLAGHRATALVANGAVMRSPSYRMVSTLGQSSIHQTVMRSLGFRLRGGLVGATGGSR
jgi:hypothetical protein